MPARRAGALPAGGETRGLGRDHHERLNGRRASFAARRPGDHPRGGLYIRPQGESARRVGEGESSKAGPRPVADRLVPGRLRIIVTDDCCQFGSNFWTVCPHGTGLRQLTHFGPAPLQGGFASYSPDGQRIVLQYNGNARCAESAPSPDGSGVAIPSGKEMRQSLPLRDIKNAAFINQNKELIWRLETVSDGTLRMLIQPNACSSGTQSSK